MTWRLFCLHIILLFIVACTQTQSEINYKSFDRNYVDPDDRFYFIESIGPYLFSKFVTGDGSTISLLDKSEQRLVKFNYLTDELVFQRGKEGPGPHENVRIKDMYEKSASYLVVDNAKDIVKEVDLTYDTTIAYFEYFDHIDRGKFLNDSMVAITNAEQNDLFISVIALENNSYKTVYNYKISDITKIERVEKLDLVFEGDFTRMNEAGQFVFYSYRSGDFFSFDFESGFLGTHQTIDEIAPPKPVNIESGGFTIHTVEPEIFVNNSAFLTNDGLYILSNVIKRSNRDNLCIDFYEFPDYQYKLTLNVPLLEDGQSPIDFVVCDSNRLFVLYENMAIGGYEFSY